MSYGHAPELSISKPPIDQLDFLVSELKRWSDLNPDLRPLQAQFKRVSLELRKERGS